MAVGRVAAAGRGTLVVFSASFTSVRGVHKHEWVRCRELVGWPVRWPEELGRSSLTCGCCGRQSSGGHDGGVQSRWGGRETGESFFDSRTEK